MRHLLLLIAALTALITQAQTIDCHGGSVQDIYISQFNASRAGEHMIIDMDITLDTLQIGSNQQVILQPILTVADGDTIHLRRVVVN